MTEDELRQDVLDQEHLRLLALGYKVSAGVTAFYSLFGLIYVFMGVIFTALPSSAWSGGEAPPPFIGWFFGGIGLAFIAVGLTFAGLKWATAVRLGQRRSPVFCQVVAALSCLEIPYGTLLGVFTFIVLGRPSVRRMFG